MKTHHISLKKQILFFIKNQYPNYVHGGAIERLAGTLNFKASNASRRCRELENEGYIEAQYNAKREVSYRYKPHDTRGKVEEMTEAQRIAFATG